MFVTSCDLQNIVGSFYSSGNIVFHPHRNILYTPISNRIKQIDLEHNITSILYLECSHNIEHIAIQPHGNLLIAVDREGQSIIYNLRADFIIAHFNFKGRVQAIAFSQDGKLLAVGIDKGYRVYEAPPLRRSFQPLLLLKKYKNRHTSKITHLSFSPDNRFLLSGSEDCRVYLSNICSIPDFIAPSFDIHKQRILNCFFNPDMTYLYTCDRGGNIYVWKWVTDVVSEAYQKRIAYKKKKLDQQRNVTQQVIKVEDEEEKQVENYSQFEKMCTKGRFIMAKKHIISHPASYVKGVKYLSDIGLVSSCYSNGKFSVWKLTDEQLEQVHTFSVGQHKINTLSINHAGNWIALGIKQLGQLIVWEWKSQSFIFNQTGLLYETSCISYNPAATVLAAGSNDGKIKLWDRKSGFCFATFEEHESQVTDVHFSNQNTLISSSLDGTVKAYDTAKYKCFRTMQPDKKCQLNCLAVEPSGEIVCAGSFDPYEIYCWNLQTGNMLQVLTGHKGPISCISFVGERFVSGSWDRTIRIHDFYAKRNNADSLDQSSEITALAGSPDGKCVAVCTFKGQIYIWDVAKSEIVAVLDCKKDLQGGRSDNSTVSADNDINSRLVRCLRYSSCGQYLIAAGKCKHILIYDIRHRLLLRKITLTNNRDIDGVVDWLNSKNIKQGINIKELEDNQSDNQDKYLPGAKKLDVSRRSYKMDIIVSRIITTDREFSVGTNFGILVFGQNRHACFSPYELLPKLTPEMIPKLLSEGQYTSAIIVGLKLNIAIEKLLRKIHSRHTQQICSELNEEFSRLLLEKISDKDIDEKLLQWVYCLLKKVGEQPKALLGSLARLQEMSRLIQINRACIGLSKIFSIDNF